MTDEERAALAKLDRDIRATESGVRFLRGPNLVEAPNRYVEQLRARRDELLRKIQAPG